MYNFRDTTDHADLTVNLPSEAMNIDGVFIENEVNGYKTLSTSGRESMTSNVDSIKIGRSDGEFFKNSNLEPRSIEVKFALFSTTPEESQQQITKIKKLCYKKEVVIYFNDDINRYVTGTVTSVKISTTGLTNSTGVISIFCANPNYYSVAETKVTAVNGSATIDYDGSYPSKPRIAITMNDDNGFIGLIDNKGSLLQFGDPDEIDGIVENKSVWGINDVRGKGFENMDDFNLSGWKLNVAPKLMKVNGVLPVQVGTIRFGDFFLNYDKWKNQTIKYITGDDWGTNASWHGPSMTRDFTPDVGGQADAGDFTSHFETNFISTSSRQVGTMQMMINTASGENVCGVVIYKNNTSTDSTVLEYYIGGEKVDTIPMTSEAHGRLNGWDGGSFKLEKFGDIYRFYNAYGIRSYKVNATKAALKARSVSYHFGRFGNVASGTNIGSPLSHIYLKSVRFVQHKVPYWIDIPNKFGKNDILVIDTEYGHVELNGILMGTLGALGNDWEKFSLDDGENKITCINSSFSNPPPTYDIYYKGVDV